MFSANNPPGGEITGKRSSVLRDSYWECVAAWPPAALDFLALGYATVRNCSSITGHPRIRCYGRSRGLGRGRGVGVGLRGGVAVTVGVGVGVAVAVAVGVAVAAAVAVGVGVGVAAPVSG